MSRIILHVGTHKTGTTTLQALLAGNRRLLAERGIVYPAVSRFPGQHALVTPWVGFPEHRYAQLAHRTWQRLTAWCTPADVRLRSEERRRARRLARSARRGRAAWRRLIERHARGTDTLFVSSEEFSRAGPQAVDFRELGAMLEGFDRRTVICALRNQLAYLQSVYLQVIGTGGQIADFPTYLQRSLRDGRAVAAELDYGGLYDRLLTGFRPDEIVFVSYEAGARLPGGVGHILDRLGLPLAADELAPLPAGDANVSPEPLAAWAACRFAPGAAGDRVVALAREAFAETFGAEARSTLYTRAEAAQVAAHFAAPNAAFEARYRAADAGFALAPLSLAPGLIHRDQLDAAFWTRLEHKRRAAGLL